MNAAGQMAAFVVLASREAYRRPVVIVLAAGAAVLIGISRSLTLFAFGQEEVMLREMGISTIRLFGLLFTVVSGARAIAAEMEEGTLQAVLVRPVRRWAYLLGKFLGLVGVLAVLMGVLAGVLLLVLSNPMDVLGRVAEGSALAFLETGVLLAASFALQVRLGAQVAATGAVVLFTLGHLSFFVYERMSGVTALAEAWWFAIPGLHGFGAEGVGASGLLLLSGAAFLYVTAFLAVSLVELERMEST